MKNIEYYKEKILDIVSRGDSIGVDKITNQPEACSDMECSTDCKIAGNCNLGLRAWCNEEHIENPKLTENEKKFLDILNPNFRYMARDKDGTVYVFPTSEKPTKDTVFNFWCGVKFHRIDQEMFNGMFSMIKWEDEEPWLIDDLRKLEVTE